MDCDIASCYDALQNDVKLKATDDRFYSFLEKFPEDKLTPSFYLEPNSETRINVSIDNNVIKYLFERYPY